VAEGISLSVIIFWLSGKVDQYFLAPCCYTILLIISGMQFQKWSDELKINVNQNCRTGVQQDVLQVFCPVLLERTTRLDLQESLSQFLNVSVSYFDHCVLF
jgi:hypothetical protein